MKRDKDPRISRRALLATGAGALSLGGVGVAAAQRDPVIREFFRVVEEENPPANNEAEVKCFSFGGITLVKVNGTILGSDSCASARLGDVQYDPASDTLSVTVETFDASPAGTLCLQVITPISYRAFFVVRAEVETVEVTHDGVEDFSKTHECGSQRNRLTG